MTCGSRGKNFLRGDYAISTCKPISSTPIQYNTIQYNTIEYNTIQYNTIQYNRIHYNTIQYNTIYNTIQYNTITLFKDGSAITYYSFLTYGPQKINK